MTADLAAAAEKVRAEPVTPTPAGQWQVVFQCGHLPDEVISAHRFEWVAELHARRRAFRHTGTGGHYNTRKASSCES